MEQPESRPAEAAKALSPMPSIWRRSVALALFFTLFGPIIGAVATILAIYLALTGIAGLESIMDLVFRGKIAQFPTELIMVGLRLGTPFAAVCGVIAAIRAAFVGRISFGDAFGAALTATVIILASRSCYSIFYLGADPLEILSNLYGKFVIFGAPSVFAAVVCRWLFYLLFWPHENGNAA